MKVEYLFLFRDPTANFESKKLHKKRIEKTPNTTYDNGEVEELNYLWEILENTMFYLVYVLNRL